jgi:spore coat protein SA
MIYHILPESEPFSEFSGGALSRWAANVLREDDNCTIVCPWADSSWGFPQERIWSLPAFRRYIWCLRILRWSRTTPLRVMWLKTVFRPLFEKLKKGDTVYIHNRPEFVLACNEACRRKEARLVLHMQNSHLMGWFRVRRESLTNLDGLVFCSAFLKTEAAEYADRARTVSIVPNGADDSMFYPEAGSKSHGNIPVVLFASRLVPAKGPHIFLEAMRLLEAQGIKAKGVVVGSSKFGGSKSTNFIKQLHRMAPSSVTFHEYCSGKPLAELFRKADIFCLPSVFDDPFPLTSLEAMASRLPVVATYSGGIPEAFAEGGGLLVERGSAVQLAAALGRLIGEASLREKMAEEGYASFQKNFTWPMVRQKYYSALDMISA